MRKLRALKVPVWGSVASFSLVFTCMLLTVSCVEKRPTPELPGQETPSTYHNTTPPGGSPLGLTSLVCPDLVESSGICIDDRGVLWTHNDSGAKPVLYAFAGDGRWLARVEVAKAEAEDWEDLCFVQRDGASYIAIGDVGDNSENRKSVDIYLIERPRLEPMDADQGVVDLEVPCVGHLRVNYPSGPVNCESLAYDPIRREFLLPSKEAFRCRLFQVDASGLLGKREVVVESSPQTAAIPLVTGADISCEGKQLVLATYGPGGLLSRAADGRHWQIDAPHGVSIFELPERTQGESICFSQDASQLLLTSEFSPTPLYRIATPTAN